MDRIEELTKYYESDEAKALYNQKCLAYAKDNLTLEYLQRWMLRNDESDKFDRCFQIWQCEKYAGLPQNKLCSLVDVSPRYYRDVREHELSLWEREVWRARNIMGQAGDKIGDAELANENALEEVINDLTAIGFRRVDAWINVDDVPEIDEFLNSALEHTGGYCDMWDKWINCRPLRYYITLSRDDHDKLRL
jgi:hypothetical protein